MTKAEARRLLHDVRRWGSVWWTAKDARFFFGPLEDAIRTLDVPGNSPGDRALVASGYAGKGDVSDWTMSAPRAAARAYRAAIRRDPDDGWSWQELGSALEDVGEYRAAQRALRRALILRSDDDWLRQTIERLSDDVRDGTGPYYAGGRIGSHLAPSWDACELLASNRPRDALRLLQGKRDVFLRKLRARAHGALGDADRVVEEWEGIARTKAELFRRRARTGPGPRSARTALGPRRRHDEEASGTPGPPSRDRPAAPPSPFRRRRPPPLPRGASRLTR